MSQFLDKETAERLNAYKATTLERIAPILGRFPLSDTVAELDAITYPHTFDYLPSSLHDISARIEREYGKAALGQYNKAVIMELIGGFDARIANESLPEGMRISYPASLKAVAETVMEMPDEDYVHPMEFFVKDLRITGLRSYPIANRLIDTNCILPKTIFRYKGLRENLRILWFVLTRLGRLSPLFRIHIDARMLGGLAHEGGAERDLVTVDLLRRNPHIRGIAGTSWLYDPQLDKLSPHQGDFRRRAVEKGGIFICDGINEAQTKFALATSKTRRAAYERGEYIPTCYTMIWARRDMLKWADRQSERERQSDSG